MILPERPAGELISFVCMLCLCCFSAWFSILLQTSTPQVRFKCFGRLAVCDLEPDRSAIVGLGGMRGGIGQKAGCTSRTDSQPISSYYHVRWMSAEPEGRLVLIRIGPFLLWAGSLDVCCGSERGHWIVWQVAFLRWQRTDIEVGIRRCHKSRAA